MTAKGIPSLGSAGARWASGPCSGGPAERPELRREGAEPAGSGSSALARLCKKRTREGRAEAAELQNALHRPGLLLAASVCPACRYRRPGAAPSSARFAAHPPELFLRLQHLVGLCASI